MLLKRTNRIAEGSREQSRLLAWVVTVEPPRGSAAGGFDPVWVIASCNEIYERLLLSAKILDGFEGVTAAESTVATQLGEITSQVAESKDDAGYAATAARLRVAASVFGT
jgi:hypothetical protein